MSALSACQKRVSDSLTDGCEPPCGCWRLNSGPLEEQPLFLTVEPSLKSRSSVAGLDFSMLQWMTLGSCSPCCTTTLGLWGTEMQPRTSDMPDKHSAQDPAPKLCLDTFDMSSFSLRGNSRCWGAGSRS